MRIFVLEDEIDSYRNPIKTALKNHDVTYAKNVVEAKLLWFPPYDLWLLDHDMEGNYEDSAHPNTGYAFLKWAIPQLFDVHRPRQVILHSQNPTGRKNMKAYLADYGIVADEFPYCFNYAQRLKEIE